MAFARFLSFLFVPSSVIAVDEVCTSMMPVDRTNLDGSLLAGQGDAP